MDRYRVTTNGGIILARSTSLENVQTVILANAKIPVYVRSLTSSTHQGWVFEIIGPVVIFTWHGSIQSDTTAEEWCPWMLQLRRAVMRVRNPTSTEGTSP